MYIFLDFEIGLHEPCLSRNLIYEELGRCGVMKILYIEFMSNTCLFSAENMKLNFLLRKIIINE